MPGLLTLFSQKCVCVCVCVRIYLCLLVHTNKIKWLRVKVALHMELKSVLNVCTIRHFALRWILFSGPKYRCSKSLQTTFPFGHYTTEKRWYRPNGLPGVERTCGE